jgi:uncharacterized LabA/DUF88 family protein
MQKKLQNYAFIDFQNLYFGLKMSGWKVDYKRFHKYLKEKCGVKKAFIFIGFISQNQSLYGSLRSAGFTLIFKPTLESKNMAIKGNCDAELVLHTMIEYANYKEAILVSADGDFYCLIRHLQSKNKFGKLLAPSKKYCSSLLRRAAKSKIIYFEALKSKLEYGKRTSQGQNR